MLDLETELLDYICGDCGGSTWDLKLAHRTDGKTFLIVTCANEQCVENKRKEIDAGPDDLMIWDELDISGQGHDELDIRQVDKTQVN